MRMVTAAMKLKGTCSLEEQDKPRQHIKKQRHHFADKDLYNQSYGFSVVIYGCESWTIKKVECQRIAFELWSWRRLLRVSWIARRSDQSILKEIHPVYSLEGLMLKLMLQYLAPWCKELTHWKRLWCWERLKAEGEADDRGWDGWMTSPTWWKRVWVSSGIWRRMAKTGMLWSMGSRRVRHDWVIELNWIPQERNSISCPNPRVFILTL